MKRLLKQLSLRVFIPIYALALMNCTNTVVSTGVFTVVEQTDSVFNNNGEMATFTVDFPMDGPQILMDSVLVFLNKQLYDACESCAHFEDDIESFSEKELFTDDGERLLDHYMEKYQTLIKDSLWKSFYSLSLKLETQAEKYITYGVEHFHCGASCGSEKYYYTFDKRDGHLIKEIISHDNLLRFFEDYPEYSVMDDYMWEFSPENDFDHTYMGLLGDHFSLVIIGWYNHFFSIDVPFGPIYSFLSPEAQTLVKQDEEEDTMLPAYLPECSEDGEAWMELDTVNCTLLGYLRAAGGPHVSTLMHYDPELELYPKRVHSIDATEGSTLFLFIYSRGHLLYCDEALVCEINDDGHLQPIALFPVDGEKDCIVSCMWYDQLVSASNGFPFDELDENRFGIHYDHFTKRLYVPIMENHEQESEYENCLRYTGRYEVLQFNGMEFVSVGTDGAWWLNADLRNYKRTISNRITADGIEQVDLMPDDTYRRAVWKGAQTLDDLRKEPDEIQTSKEMFKYKALFQKLFSPFPLHIQQLSLNL